MAHIPGLGERLIGQPDLAERERRALAVKGEMPSRIEAQQSGSLTIEDLTRFEFWWLRRGLSFLRGGTQGAVAAQSSIFSLSKTAASLTLAIVDQIIFGNPTAAALEFKFGLSVTNPIGTNTMLDGAPLDCRQQSTNLLLPSALQIFAGNTAAGPLGNFGVPSVIVPPNSSLVLPTAYVISDSLARQTGGQMTLFVQAVTLNVAASCFFRWYERAQLSTEL